MSRRGRQRSWIHAVGAVPVAAIGCVLLLPSPGARGSGPGPIVTMIPCAIGLALSFGQIMPTSSAAKKV